MMTTGLIVGGVATGLPAELLGPAFAGALAGVIYRPGDLSGNPRSDAAVILRMCIQVVLGTLISAWSSIPLAHVIGGFIPAAAGMAPDMAKWPIAICNGFGGLYSLDRWIFPKPKSEAS